MLTFQRFASKSVCYETQHVGKVSQPVSTMLISEVIWTRGSVCCCECCVFVWADMCVCHNQNCGGCWYGCYGKKMCNSISLYSNKGIRNWLRLMSPITNTVGKLVLRGPWQQSANGTIRHHAHPLLSWNCTQPSQTRSCCPSYMERRGSCVTKQRRERPRDRFSGQWAHGLSRSKTLKAGRPKYIFLSYSPTPLLLPNSV